MHNISQTKTNPKLSFIISINVSIIISTSAYGASPVIISRASRSVVASFSQLEADPKVTT